MDNLKIFLCFFQKMYRERYVAASELAKAKETLPAEFCEQKSLRKKRWGALLKWDFESYRELTELDLYLNKRMRLNREFIKREQAKPYEIEGNRLDAQQIAAVVACEDAELILASAGSGKSASLMAKVNYIVQELGVPAAEVVVIAFTKKVVQELKERMAGSGVEICTFHSFGNKIIKQLKVAGELKLVPDGFLEKTVERILNSWVKNKTLGQDELKQFGGAEGMGKLLVSTLQLMKNEQISLKEFRERILKMPDEKVREKALFFYNYFARAVRIYGEILRDNRLYDYADMLAWSTRIIRRMPKGELKYRYILVDEVQDLSLSKSLLLAAMLENATEAKLFAVGDDWQSIYRFAGSNLGVLQDFEKRFRRETYRGVIRKTYRFGQPTAWVSEYFVRKNPAQSKKKVEVFKKTKTPIEICFCDDRGPATTRGSAGARAEVAAGAPQDYAAVDGFLQKLYLKIGEELFLKRVQVISRYNRDLFRLVEARTRRFKNARIVEEKADGVVLKWLVAGRELTVAFCSMHKSKGITRDIVFVINMNEGEKGMPSTRVNEPILEILLARPDKYPLAEERRLFYVAITRATELTVIVAERKKVSRFVREIAKNLGGEMAEAVS